LGKKSKISSKMALLFINFFFIEFESSQNLLDKVGLNEDFKARINQLDSDYVSHTGTENIIRQMIEKNFQNNLEPPGAVNFVTDNRVFSN
jgi:hypothetical protein